MRVSTFLDLFRHEIADVYSAEKQIVEVLPKIIEAATNQELKQSLAGHLDLTHGHLDRLLLVSAEMRWKIPDVVCEGMKGILKEVSQILKIENLNVRDAAIISTTQRVEHYEMSVYGSASAFARNLGLGDTADLLEKTFQEEVEADQSLSKLAKGGLFKEGVNEKALGIN